MSCQSAQLTNGTSAIEFSSYQKRIETKSNLKQLLLPSLLVIFFILIRSKLLFRQYEVKERSFRNQLVSLSIVLPILQQHIVLCQTFSSSANKFQFLEIVFSLIDRLNTVSNLPRFMKYVSTIFDFLLLYLGKCNALSKTLITSHFTIGPQCLVTSERVTGRNSHNAWNYGLVDCSLLQYSKHKNQVPITFMKLYWSLKFCSLCNGCKEKPILSLNVESQEGNRVFGGKRERKSVK